MGSIDAACIAGFLCRLCSEMHRTVIHIYSDQGQKHNLAGKINAYLPVNVSFTNKIHRAIELSFNRTHIDFCCRFNQTIHYPKQSAKHV